VPLFASLGPSCPHCQRRGAVRIQCATGGAVWVSHLKKKEAGTFKLPATSVLAPAALADVPTLADPPLFIRHGTNPGTFQEVWVTVDGGVAYVHSDFYNGAMSTEQCEHLTAALREVEARPDVKVCDWAWVCAHGVLGGCGARVRRRGG
jgi:putative two-component system hydrogenase maturation factor HypX/HoxX